MPPPATARCGTIDSVRPGPKGPLVKVSGFDDVDQARTMCGCELLVRRDLVADGFDEPADEDDLVGRAVEDAEHGLLGTIEDVIVTGANDVWVVHGPFGEILIPVIDDVVLDAGEGEGPIIVRLLDGLMPGEGETA